MIASFATIIITASSLPPHWNLQGHRAVVTGGSKGLGRAIVEELLAHGCEVLTCARDVSPLASLLADERCTALQADVSLESGRGANAACCHAAPAAATQGSIICNMYEWEIAERRIWASWGTANHGTKTS